MQIKLYSTVLDCPDPHALADFYARLTGWIVPFANEEYAVLCPPQTEQGQYPGLTFQKNEAYIAPVWPEEPEKQQQMEHLDFAVDDLDAAAAHAIACGARMAPAQFAQDWTVMLDPAGHPFCLLRMPDLFKSPAFALR